MHLLRRRARPSTRLRALVTAIGFVVLATVRPLGAQLSLNPDYESRSVETGTTDIWQVQLVNNEPYTWYADLSCVAEGAVTSCSVEPTSIALLGISDQMATVTFTTGAIGTGQVRLTVGDLEAVLDVTVTGPPPPPYVVSPDGQSVTVAPGGRSRQAFIVTNNRISSWLVRPVAGCSGTAIDVSSCTVSAAAVYLRPGESSPVTVSYVTLPTAGSGKVVLRAQDASGSVKDSGYVNVTVTAPSLAIVHVAPSTAAVTNAKEQCVTFALRRESAAECGVLRLTHALPAVRTRNTGREPTLVYYYDLASRGRTIGVDVTMSPSATYQSADSVRVTISTRTGGQCVSPQSKTYSAAHWFTGTPGARSRRVGVGIGLESSGNSYIRQYCVEASLLRAGGSQPLAPIQYREFAMVQRYNTAFGAGWWLAGLEELYFNQPDSIGGASAAILWIGGDASTRRYRCRASGCNGVYLPDDTVSQKDSLVLSGSEFTRYLPNGLKVVFDSYGRHVRTVNRHGAITTFGYSGTTRRLLSITVPPAGSGLTYNFVYDGGGSLVRVDAPGTSSVRSVTIRRFGLAVTGFVDPDGRAVSFAPPAWAGSDSTIVERVTDRRGTATYFYQEGWNPTVGSVYTALGGGREQWQWFRTPSGLSAPPASVQPVPDSVGEAYLRVTDGRNNVTRIWLDRLGAPVKITNALGNSTIVERGDPRFAGLATKVVQPDGRALSASYDDRGNILASYDINPFGTGQDAVTRYHWDARWDFADSVIAPSGLATTFGYDYQTGNRSWQQTGPDASRRVSFTYYTTGAAAGLFKSTVLPATPADTLFYDGLGNPNSYKTSLGYLTQFFNDAIGRTYQSRQQIDVSGITRMLPTTTQFDVMSRDTLTIAGDSTESVVSVRRTLDAAGDDSVVTRWTTPDAASIGNMITRTFRDVLGRVVKEVAPDGYADSTVYDAVGNVIKTIDRTGDSVTFAYDSLNRLRRRYTSSKHFGPESIGLARGALMSPDPVEAVLPNQGLSQPYPWGRPGGYDIATVVDTFVYHPTTMLLTDANNDFAQVHFEYYPNGKLAVEQNTQAPWSGTGASHVYRDSIVYDINGRRVELKYPTAIAPAGGSRVRYYYSYGDLSAIMDLEGRTTSYTVDARGQLIRKNVPGGWNQRFTYDYDGNLTSDSVSFGSDSIRRAQHFTYDARGKRIGLSGKAPNGSSSGSSSESITYNILGQLTSSTNAIPNFYATNTYELDALGNMVKRSGNEGGLAWVNNTTGTVTSTNSGVEWQYYKPQTGRLWYSKSLPQGAGFVDTIGTSTGGPAVMNWYDAAGNLTWTGKAILKLNANGYPEAQSERRMYYGADGKLRAVDARGLYRLSYTPETSGYSGFSQSFEEYRYDALGRRVATKFDQKCDDLPEFNDDNATCHLSGIRRTIWDGDQELGEIQVPNDGLENDTYVGQGDYWSTNRNYSPFFGAVAYIFDGMVDQPLAVTRLRYSNRWSEGIWQSAEISAFTMYPFWNVHGQTDYGYSTSTTAGCPSGYPGQLATCVAYVLQPGWLPYRDATLWQRAWHGTLLEDKVGAGGLMYRRNRYYDSKSGRFTQEDPIGLAGGLNLYGFAGGDPVNFSDPFGLWPCPELCGAGAGGGAIAVGGRASIALRGAAAITGALAPAASGAALGVIGVVLLGPAFPGDGVSMAYTGGLAAGDATVVYNKKEAKQIRAAIKSVTGQDATDSQFNCMSEFIHECKDQGEGGSKNKKGDFTWDELVQMAKDLFGRQP